MASNEIKPKEHALRAKILRVLNLLAKVVAVIADLGTVLLLIKSLFSR